MAATANLKSKISLDSTEFKAGIRRVKLTAAAASRSIGKGFRKMGAGLGKVAGMMIGLVKSLAKLAALAATITFAAAIAGAVVLSKVLRGAISEAASYEQIKVTMTAFLKDANKARDTLAEINEFSVVTPFETKGLQEATNKMLGAGIAGDQVVDVLKEISAVSNSTEQVGELADALSKGFAKGKFQTEELNKFLERGINLMPELARVTGKTGEELQKAVQKGLKFDDVRSALAAMSAEGGLFFGVLGKQSTTFNGLISTLISNWQAFQTQLGKPINDALKPLLIFATTKIQEMTAGAESFGAAIGKRIANFTKLVEGVNFAGIGQRIATAFNPSNFSSSITKIGELMTSVMSDALRISLEYGYAVLRGLLSAEGLAFISDNLLEIFKSLGQSLADILFNVFDFVKDVFSKKSTTTTQGSNESDEDFKKRRQSEFADKMDRQIKSKKLPDEDGASNFISALRAELGGVDIAFSDKTKSLLKDITSNIPEGVTSQAKVAERSAAEKAQAQARAKRAKRESDFDKGIGAKSAKHTPFEAMGPSSSLANKAVPLPGEFGSAFGTNGPTGPMGKFGSALGTNGATKMGKFGSAFGTNGATGGLGAVKRVGQKGKDAVAKKEDSLVSTNEHLTTQNALMQEQITLLREGLGV